MKDRSERLWARRCCTSLKGCSGGDAGFNVGRTEILTDDLCQVEVEIKNADGLHMRPAMLFVDLANRFICDIQVSNDETSVDAKSIMQMTMLAATCGTKLTIRASGEDAKQAVHDLQELVELKLFDDSGDKTASA